MENERADAGRDGRTRLARPKSQARTGFPLQLTIRAGLVHVGEARFFSHVLELKIICNKEQDRYFWGELTLRRPGFPSLR